MAPVEGRRDHRNRKGSGLGNDKEVIVMSQRSKGEATVHLKPFVIMDLGRLFDALFKGPDARAAAIQKIDRGRVSVIAYEFDIESALTAEREEIEAWAAKLPLGVEEAQGVRLSPKECFQLIELLTAIRSCFEQEATRQFGVRAQQIGVVGQLLVERRTVHSLIREIYLGMKHSHAEIEAAIGGAFFPSDLALKVRSCAERCCSVMLQINMWITGAGHQASLKTPNDAAVVGLFAELCKSVAKRWIQCTLNEREAPGVHPDWHPPGEELVLDTLLILRWLAALPATSEKDKRPDDHWVNRRMEATWVAFRQEMIQLLERACSEWNLSERALGKEIVT